MIGKARGHRPWFAGIVVLAAAAAAGLSHRVPSNSRSVSSAPPAIRVTVAPVKTRDVPIYLSAPGTVLAWNTVAVRSQIDGKLTAVNFVEGQDVRAGDVLAQIDTSALQATLNQAVAKKAEDEAQLAEAAKELERDQEGRVQQLTGSGSSACRCRRTSSHHRSKGSSDDDQSDQSRHRRGICELSGDDG
jgi:multidrug efflux system membrane fusion protein